MEPLLWNLRCGKFDYGVSLGIIYGIFVLEYLWKLCCGIFVYRTCIHGFFVVETLLWHLCCGVFVVESLLWNLCGGLVVYGTFFVESFFMEALFMESSL